LPPHLQHLAHAITWLAWGVFVGDYVIRLWLANHRRRDVVRHIADLLMIVSPVLRPLHLLRRVTLLRVMNRRAVVGLRGRVALYAAGSSLILAFCGALVVLDEARKSPHANVHDFADATWWAIRTMTTVGYGDGYPIPRVGRVAAGGLMVGGVALLGGVTATLASWLVQHLESFEDARPPTCGWSVRPFSASSTSSPAR
jgi:voltage-gated potassium channel